VGGALPSLDGGKAPTESKNDGSWGERFCILKEGPPYRPPPFTPLKPLIKLTGACASVPAPKPAVLGIPLSRVRLGEVLLGRDGTSLFQGLVPQTFWDSEFAWKALAPEALSAGSGKFGRRQHCAPKKRRRIARIVNVPFEPREGPRAWVLEKDVVVFQILLVG
jgi:hypothetical protein